MRAVGRGSTLALTLALLPGCVLHVRHAELGLLRLKDGTRAWTYHPLPDLLELILAPLALVGTPLLFLCGEGDRDLALFTLSALLPGLVCEDLALESRIGPQDGFLAPLEGTLGGVALRLARRQDVSSLVVSPRAAAQVVAGVHPYTSLRQLAEEYGAELREVEGVTVLAPGEHSVYVDPSPERVVGSLAEAAGRPVVVGPDLLEPLDSGRLSVAARGRTLLIGPGELTLDELLELELLAPLSTCEVPPREDCQGPLVDLDVQAEPLDELAARLARIGGRPVSLCGGDPSARLSLRLSAVPWEQAVAFLAWAADRELRPGPGPGLTLVAGEARLLGSLYAPPRAALELLARAAGRRLLIQPPAPGVQIEAPVRLRLAGVPAQEALRLGAELLGFVLEELPADREGVRALRPWRVRPWRAGPPSPDPPSPGPPSPSSQAPRLPGPPSPEASALAVAQLRELLEERLNAATEGREEEAPAAGPPPVPLFGVWAGWAGGLVCSDAERPPTWGEQLGQLVVAGGPPVWEDLEARLRAWDPAWHPALRARVMEHAARARAQAELDRLELMVQAGAARQALEAVPELSALAVRLAAMDRPAAHTLREGLQRIGELAGATLTLEARSDGRAQAVLLGQGDLSLSLALIDGRVLGPGDPLPDRAGQLRTDATLAGVNVGVVTVRCDGQLLPRLLRE